MFTSNKPYDIIKKSGGNGYQHSLLGYHFLREEINEGGFVQLIQNGFGPYIFDNPFAKAMRQFGAKEFAKLIYSAAMSASVAPSSAHFLLYKNEERVYLKNKVINPHLARLGKDEDPYDPQNYKRFEQEE